MGSRAPLALAPLLLLVASLAACDPQEAQAENESPGVQPRELPRVRVAPVVEREMRQILETTSVLESEREVQVYPRMAGMVAKLCAEEGQAVQVDEPLAVLQDDEQALAVRDARVALEEAHHDQERRRLAAEEAGQALSTAKLAAEHAERDYQRNVQLFEGEDLNLLSRSALEASALARDNALADLRQGEIALETSRLEIEASATAVRRAEVAVEQAELALSHTRILAPFSGIVAERRVRVGDSVGTGAPVFVLTDPDLLRLVFHRPQEELVLFHPPSADGESPRLDLSATAEALPGRSFQGSIERISPTIDASSGQFRVTARLTPEEGGPRLLPGMLLRISIVTARHPNAWVVPKRALSREGERRYLLAVEDGTVRRVEVSEGFAEDAFVEVQPLEGSRLAPGDHVIVVGARDMADGDSVEVDVDRGETPTAEPPGGG